MNHALMHAHLRNNQMSARQFLRAAYQWRYGSDLIDLALCNDTKLYEEQGKVPQYAADYLLHIYGTH